MKITLSLIVAMMAIAAYCALSGSGPGELYEVANGRKTACQQAAELFNNPSRAR